VGHMNLALSLDFGGKWMTAEEKDLMRRVIAKATYGRRSYGEDGPVRFRDVNWVGWDLPHFLALTAIEGLEGFDREAYEVGAQTVRAFCDWGIDDSGVVFESNGKTPGSFAFITMSMVALARRGENLWGHPHWRKLLQGQIQMTSPSGRVTVNSGTQYEPYSRQSLSLQLVDALKSFYPGSRLPDYLLTKATQSSSVLEDEMARGWVLRDFDPGLYRRQVPGVKRLRLPSPTYPGFVKSLLYDSDYVSTTRAELELPLDFSAPTQGVFSSYSDASPTAAWINMMVRPNHYIGAGHHHADAGMFHFSALGVDWFTQSPFTQEYAGRYFNLVLVDGESEPFSIPGQILGYNAPAKFLGSTSSSLGALAGADLTNAYSYRWLTQPPQVWSSELQGLGWELDPSPANIRTFAGTTRMKMRPWWSTYVYSNYIPTCRAPFNPMRYVYRSVGLVRGAHPYGIVIDDLQKDEAEHLYEWAAMLNAGVWKAEIPGLPSNMIALGFRIPDAKAPTHGRKESYTPSAGDPLLLVCLLGHEGSGDPSLPLFRVETAEGPKDKSGKAQAYDRLLISRREIVARFRVLLLPVKFGEILPSVHMGASELRLSWSGQEDGIAFHLSSDGRTQITIRRGSETLSGSN